MEINRYANKNYVFGAKQFTGVASEEDIADINLLGAFTKLEVETNKLFIMLNDKSVVTVNPGDWVLKSSIGDSIQVLPAADFQESMQFVDTVELGAPVAPTPVEEAPEVTPEEEF